MIAQKNPADEEINMILDALRKEYLPQHPKAKIDIYRYYPRSIWVRIIDGEFAGKEIPERCEPIWALLGNHLPDRVQEEIGLVLCLAPEETKTSGMNLEFEDPRPTPL